MDLLLARKTEMLSSSKPGVCVCVCAELLQVAHVNRPQTVETDGPHGGGILGGPLRMGFLGCLMKLGSQGKLE